MPFKSEAQRRLLWAKHPEVAQRWADTYGTPKALPKHAPERHVMQSLKKRATDGR